MMPFQRVALYWVSLVLLAALSWGAPAAAEEYIQSYHADISVSDTGELTVEETIRATVEGRAIKRGIFRDFPLDFVGKDGRTHRVGFSVVSVERDGEPEDWHTESVDGGVRIYTGSKDVFLDDGSHTFAITYRTDRQLGFFDDHDELYWNVTGNGWQFRMASISATVTLPSDATVTEADVFTGERGEKGKDARISIRGNVVDFHSTRPFAVGEGMTIGVAFPKGVVTTSDMIRRWWWIQDNLASIIGLTGLLAIFAWALRSWLKIGRDPARGIVVPRWDPPEGISPALVNFIVNNENIGAGWQAMSASLIDLAVKGYVKLDDLKRSIVVKRTDLRATKGLPTGQRALLAGLGGPGQALTIDKKNGEAVAALGERFKKALESEHSKKYYQAHMGYFAVAMVASAVILFALLAFGNLSDNAIALVAVPCAMGGILGFLAGLLGRGFRPGRSLVVRIVMGIVLIVAGLVVISFGGLLVIALLVDSSDPNDLIAFVSAGGIVLIDTLYFFLIGAPTPLGRRLMDGIEGLRTYLVLAEADRMNLAGAPEMSPSHYEKLLAYAVALGVEKPWTKTFRTWLASASAGAAAATYSPLWYTGNVGNFSSRIETFSASMASTIASSVPHSESSSFSGGGGSSGGGGGGGGGGGW